MILFITISKTMSKIFHFCDEILKLFLLLLRLIYRKAKGGTRVKKQKDVFQHPDLYACQDTQNEGIAKRQIMAQKACKYHTLKIGFLYAVLSLLFFVWELYYIVIGSEKVGLMLIPFVGLFVCLVRGITLMLKDRQHVLENSTNNNTISEYCTESF